MGIKHTFVSAIADDADDTLVRPSDWNADHTIDADVDMNGFNLIFNDATGIEDDSGNEFLLFQKTASAVNYFEMTNAATGNAVILDGTGSDTDVGLDFRTKGDGNHRFYQDAGSTLQMTIADGVMFGTGTTEPGAGNIAFADAKGIFDDSGNEQLIFQKTASANNYWEMTNGGSATFGDLYLSAAGSDSDIYIQFYTKGFGSAYINGNSAAFGTGLSIVNLGANSASIQVAASNFAAGSYTLRQRASDSFSQFQASNDLEFVSGNSSGDGAMTFKPSGGTNAGQKLCLTLDAIAFAVNSVQIFNAATGNGPEITPIGSDTNIDLELDGKGTGEVRTLGGLRVDGPARTPNPGELTIASGAITATGSYHTVDTEADAASDDLDTISGGLDGMRLVIRAVNDARTVVAKDGTGNLQLAGDCTLDNAQDTLELIYDNALSAWLEIGRSDNGA